MDLKQIDMQFGPQPALRMMWMLHGFPRNPGRPRLLRKLEQIAAQRLEDAGIEIFTSPVAWPALTPDGRFVVKAAALVEDDGEDDDEDEV